MTCSAWVPIWPAWAAIVRVWVRTALDLVSTGTACRWISRAWIRFRGADGIPGVGAATGLGSMAPAAALGSGASANLGQAASLGTLSVPPSWADAVSSVTPLPALDANVMPGGWGATPSPVTGTAVSKLPLGGMVGREGDGAAQRIGFRSSVIPRSPVAG